MFSFFESSKKATPPVQHWPFVLASGESIDIRCVRDARARRLRLIINDGGVRLTLPLRCPENLARQFLFEHRAWLAQQWQKRPEQIETPAFYLGADFDLLLRGKAEKISWQTGKFIRIELVENGISIAMPERATLLQVKRGLKEFYLQEARKDVGQWLPHYLPALPSAPLAIKFRVLSTLWGSLSPSDGLLLDLSLVLGKPSAFEYVLVHELCHLIHRNHSRSFWREVEKRFPDWRDEREYLHGEGLILKSNLKRLIS
jgi:predicted metal-dependent hydrolase